MISVQDILEIPDLDLRLLAGAGAANDSVRWVHVDDVQQSTQSLKGGELLLTTGRGFTGSEAQQVERLEELVGRNIVGLGFGTGFGFDEVPAALVRSAEDCGLPLLEIPPHISFSVLTEAVAAKIVNDRYSLLQRSLAVYEKLTRIVLEEEGLGAILATLSGLTGCFAVLFDFHGAVLGQASSRRHFGAKTIGELWRAITERRTGRAAFAIDLGGTSLEARAYPVVAAHRTVAFIVAVKDSGSFNEYDRVVLHNVVTATALELVKQRAVAETEKRLVGDFLDGLTTSTLPADEIARRLKVFGLDPQAAHLVMILEFDGREPVAAHAVPERLHWAVDEFMVEHRLACISASRDDCVVVLLEPGDLSEGDVRALAGELLAEVRGLLPEIAILVGLGRSHPSLADLRRSYFEASYAIRISRLRGDSGAVAGYAELGSYSLLLGLQDTPSLGVFCDSVLGKLQEHDEKSTCDLLPSLAAFLEANGRWGDAADKLFIHRHSLRYRMKRVQQITGRDLSEPQDRMEFWLALRAREFIDGADDRARA